MVASSGQRSSSNWGRHMSEDLVVRTVGIAGAGFMGSGIAESAARADLQVVLYEPDDAPLSRSRDRIAASLDHAVRRGKLDGDEAGALQERIRFTSDLAALGGVGVVGEAVARGAGAQAGPFRRARDRGP